MGLLKSEYICEMQECRNWQTSKTKDLVINAIVWVQVPSPACQAFTGNCKCLFIISQEEAPLAYFYRTCRIPRALVMGESISSLFL